MDCKRARNLMMDHLDGNINEKAETILQEHLNMCSHCREEFDILLDMEYDLENLIDIGPEEDFVYKVMEEIDLSLYEAKPLEKAKGNVLPNYYSSLKGILVLIGIYGVTLFMLKKMKDWITPILVNLLNHISRSNKLQYFFNNIISTIARVVLNPGKVLISILKYAEGISFKYIVIYGMGLLTLVIILAVIETRLFKMLNREWGPVNENTTFK